MSIRTFLKVVFFIHIFLPYCIPASSDPNCIEGNAWLGLRLEPYRAMARGQYIESPGGRFRAGLTCKGDFVVHDSEKQNNVWRAGVSDGVKLLLKPDGNLLLIDGKGKVIWQTNAYRKTTYCSQLVRMDVFLAVTTCGAVAVAECDKNVIWQSHCFGAPSELFISPA